MRYEILLRTDVWPCFLIQLVFTLQTPLPPEPQTHLDSVPVLSIAGGESSSPAEPETWHGLWSGLTEAQAFSCQCSILQTAGTFQRQSCYCMKLFSLITSKPFGGWRGVINQDGAIFIPREHLCSSSDVSSGLFGSSETHLEETEQGFSDFSALQKGQIHWLGSF